MACICGQRLELDVLFGVLRLWWLIGITDDQNVLSTPEWVPIDSSRLEQYLAIVSCSTTISEIEETATGEAWVGHSRSS